MTTPSGCLEPAIEIVRGFGAAGALRQLGALYVIVTTDELATGPSSSNPHEHVAMRKLYWQQLARLGPQPEQLPQVTHQERQVFDADGLRAKLRQAPPGALVRVWASRQYNDQLFLAWALDGLKRARIPVSRVRLVHAGHQELDRLNPEQFTRYAKGAKSLRREFLEEALRVWRSFTSKNPERLRQEGRSSTFVGHIVGHYALALPRCLGRSDVRLRLSVFDESVLGRLSPRSWTSAFDLCSAPQILKDLVVSSFGPDLFVRRLWAWSEHSGRGAVDRREGRKGYGVLLAEYKLTEVGRQLLDGGMRNHGDAPALHVGGYSVFATSARWVAMKQGRGFALARWGGT